MKGKHWNISFDRSQTEIIYRLDVTLLQEAAIYCLYSIYISRKLFKRHASELNRSCLLISNLI
jgi:hypothetical protein